jgi:NADH dehydrogenase [ubiquinone] 1 alpha subcomplex assembly factor 7
MRHCLAHPEHGYYMRSGAPVFGARGDFTTSPEISQMFGELVAVWVLAAHAHLAAAGALADPAAPFHVVELGPGRGALAADVLRVLGRLTRGGGGGGNSSSSSPRPTVAALHLVETSRALRRVQAEALRCEGVEEVAERGGGAALVSARVSAQGPLPGLRVYWHDDLADVPSPSPSPPLFLLAQELFDALPVHQLVWAGEGVGWRERLVEVADGGEGAAVPSPTPAPPLLLGGGTPSPAAAAAAAVPSPRNHFRMVRAATATPASIAYTVQEKALVEGASPPSPTPHPRPADGAVAEYCPAGIKLAHAIASRLSSPASGGGAALLIDYGSATSSRAWTLRGIRRHAFVDPLSDPGDVDLSADVDFAALARAAREAGADASPTVTQGEFLLRMGIGARLERLMGAAGGA